MITNNYTQKTNANTGKTNQIQAAQITNLSITTDDSPLNYLIKENARLTHENAGLKGEIQRLQQVIEGLKHLIK